MSTVTTPSTQSTGPSAVLHLGIELAEQTWKLAFTPGLGQRPRIRNVAARDLEAVMREVARALARFNLPATTRVVSCYEAGRDGFWVHRALLAQGIENQVVDAASIEVNRRARRAKADRLDAEKLALMLVRATAGDARVWRAVRVPSDEAEQARQLPRELEALTHDRTRVTNRIGSLLATQGIKLALGDDFVVALAAARRWDGKPLPEALRSRLEREWALVEGLTARLAELQALRRTDIRRGTDPAHAQMRKLLRLRGIGWAFACVLVRECFGWRQFRNRREVGACAGLTPTPFQTGNSHRELGISKAGNRHVRYVAIELAWFWLRYQPQSELSRWFRERFAGGGPARVRVGIVALARKLLVALWRYLKFDEVPAGAVLNG